MLDIQSFNSALKAKWVQKYLNDNNQAKWKLFHYFTKKHGSKLLLTGNLNQADVAGFTKEVIQDSRYSIAARTADEAKDKCHIFNCFFVSCADLRSTN